MILSNLIIASALAFDAGADLRIRQEIMENVPGNPGGGLMSTAERGKTKNHMRFRPRVWGEIKLDTEDSGTWKIFARVADEFRWNVNYTNRSNEFPDELYLDNLYLDATGLFDGFLDFRVGRQDLLFLYGLDHIFMDGTPGDGSRSAFSDVARATLHFTEASKLDIIALFDNDLNHLRWGTDESRDRRETAIDPRAKPGMDDWGFGLVWSSEFTKDVPYQLFAIGKHVSAWYDGDGVHRPGWFRELVGFKTTPRIADDVKLQFEGMTQLGADDDGEFICAWSAYAGGEWRDSSKHSWQPFVQTGLHWMSGDDSTADEAGGRSAWDPMWSRAENDSCLFQYGTLYGVGFWSNMYFWKTTVGLQIGPRHLLSASTGPIFADQQDNLGGGNGMFKGLLSQLRYEFPLLTKSIRHDLGWNEPERGLEIYGHLITEFFNPGDYYATDKPSWFVRWQVEFKF